jgi:hypothetical protein
VKVLQCYYRRESSAATARQRELSLSTKNPFPHRLNAIASNPILYRPTEAILKWRAEDLKKKSPLKLMAFSLFWREAVVTLQNKTV